MMDMINDVVTNTVRPSQLSHSLALRPCLSHPFESETEQALGDGLDCPYPPLASHKRLRGYVNLKVVAEAMAEMQELVTVAANAEMAKAVMSVPVAQLAPAANTHAPQAPAPQLQQQQQQIMEQLTKLTQQLQQPAPQPALQPAPQAPPSQDGLAQILADAAEQRKLERANTNALLTKLEESRKETHTQQLTNAAMGGSLVAITAMAGGDASRALTMMDGT